MQERSFPPRQMGKTLAASMQPGGYLMIDGKPRRIVQAFGVTVLLEGGERIPVEQAVRYPYSPPGGGDEAARRGPVPGRLF